MKKFFALFCVAAMLLALCACASDTDTTTDGSTDETTTELVTYSWPKDDWLDPLPKYSDGEIIELVSGLSTASTIGIDGTTYEEFLAYVEKLKDKGFTYYDTGDDIASESCELDDGLTIWTATDGTLYIMLKYIASDSGYYDSYGCNVRIYGYTQKPSSWK